MVKGLARRNGYVPDVALRPRVGRLGRRSGAYLYEPQLTNMNRYILKYIQYILIK